MTTRDISRDLILGFEFQRLVGVGLAETLSRTLKLGRHADVLSDEFIQSKQLKIEECRDGDISISGRIFREPFDITDLNGVERKSSVVNTLRTCKDVLQRRGNAQESFNYCRSFHSQVREIFHLVEYIREVRNILSHDTRSRNEFGAFVAAVGCAVRLTELLPVPSDYLADQKGFIEKATSILRGDQPIVLNRSEVDNEEQPSNELLLEEARALVAEMQSISSSISVNVKSLRDTVRIDREPSPVESQSEVPTPQTEHDDSEQDFISLMTVPMLRQRLEQINTEIRDFLGDRWVGPASSLLQGAIVDEVLINEPKMLDDMLSLPDVSWRYERYKDLMDVQVKEFGAQIEEALQSTAWSFETMV